VVKLSFSFVAVYIAQSFCYFNIFILSFDLSAGDRFTKVIVSLRSLSISLRARQFKQIWNSSIETSSKGGNYKLFKGELKFENYLDILEDKDKFTLCRFRTTNHRLPVEVGRW